MSFFSFEIHVNLANNLPGNFMYDQINVKKKNAMIIMINKKLKEPKMKQDAERKFPDAGFIF